MPASFRQNTRIEEAMYISFRVSLGMTFLRHWSPSSPDTDSLFTPSLDKRRYAFSAFCHHAQRELSQGSDVTEYGYVVLNTKLSRAAPYGGNCVCRGDVIEGFPVVTKLVIFVCMSTATCRSVVVILSPIAAP